MPQTIAIFGATGDSAGYCLVAALNAGCTCTALARTPSKLTASLKAKGVSTSALEHLTIISGNVRDIAAVKRTLQLPSGEVVDRVVSGIGGTLTFQWSLRRPFTLSDPTICQSAGMTIVQALQELRPSKKPLFINISTTGIPSEGMPRDVPLAFVPMYRYMLATPHEDKKVLEEKLAEHFRVLPESERGPSAYVNVRPSFLMDGDGMGLDRVREGIDAKPAVGYTIRRKDVGTWIYERLVKPENIKAEWMNNGVTITY